MELVRPAEEHVPSFREALLRGWSPSSTDPERRRQELERLQADPDAYLAGQEHREGGGEPVVLPDGSLVPRLPGFTRWMWEGEFCGAINVRWQPGTVALPPHVLGHVGYGVVPWQRRRGHATAALRQLLPELVGLGLPYVELTTDVANTASQRVITANGGVLVERFLKPEAYGPERDGLRWRIVLPAPAGAATAPGSARTAV